MPPAAAPVTTEPAPRRRRSRLTWALRGAAALGEELKHAQAAGDPDLGNTYYRHWLAALESILGQKGVASAAILQRYRDAWDHAADRTPHGSPIELREEDFKS